MKDTFDRALQLVLAHEGGYVDHPKDPGGATNRGITQRVYNAWRGAKGLRTRTVRSITQEELQSIYREQYWDAVRADDLPPGIDYCVFDAAVNSGPSRAAKWLQEAVGVTADGIVGTRTLVATVEAAARDEEGLIATICSERLAFMRRLKTWRYFGRGWTRRVIGDEPGVQNGDIGVIDYATMIARGDHTYGLPLPIGENDGEAAGKADPADLDVMRTPEAVGGGLAGLGVAGTVLLQLVPQLKALGDSAVIEGVVAFCVVAGVALTVWAAVCARREVVA